MPDIAYIELVEGLGVEVADEELGAVVDVALVLLDQDTVEVSGFGLTLAAADDVASESSLGSSVDEAADVASMLLLQVVHFLVLVVELLKLESPRTFLAGELELAHCDA